jgi:hypothetical protein
MSVDHFTVAETRKGRSLVYVTGSSFTLQSNITITVHFQTHNATVLQVLGQGTAVLVEIPFGPIRTGDALLIIGSDPNPPPIGTSGVQASTTGANVVPRPRHHRKKGKNEKCLKDTLKRFSV